MKANQAAFDAGQLAERLAGGYYSHLVAITIAGDPKAIDLVPSTLPDQNVPVGFVKRKDGTNHTFHFKHFLHLAQSDEFLSEEFKKIWLSGSLLMLGDVLAKNKYFDRAPELELVRHLRNGIAHGNLFRIDNPTKLKEFPAHNHIAWVKSNDIQFEITTELEGSIVLFDYMEAGDVLDLLMSVGLYLIRMGNGDPLRKD